MNSPVTMRQIAERAAVSIGTVSHVVNGTRHVNADTVKAFCTALKERFNDPSSGLGKAYLRLLVDEIRLDGNALVVTGSHRRLADAIGFMQKRKLGEVPSFVNDWRARWDANPRPPGS